MTSVRVTVNYKSDDRLGPTFIYLSKRFKYSLFVQEELIDPIDPDDLFDEE